MTVLGLNQKLDLDSCRKWASAPATSPPEGPPRGQVDQYIAGVKLRAFELPSSGYERIRSRLLRYDIFPPTFLRYVICPPGELNVGSVIVQRLGFGPLALESGVRIVDAWDSQTKEGQRAGFRYVTLAGHSERGAASFEVVLGRDGTLNVVFEARSVAGSLASRIGRPVARLIQVSLTRAALRRVSGT